MGLIRSGLVIILLTLLFLALFLTNAFLIFDWSLEYENIKIHEDKINDLTPEKTIEETYYQNYSCPLLECLKNENSISVLVSQKTKDYFHKKVVLLTSVTLILLLLLFLFLEKRHSIFTLSGILMIFATLPYAKMDWILKLFPDGKITEFVSIFFTKSSNVFTIMIILGSIILFIGIAFEFLNLGLKINNVLDKFRKNKNPEPSKDKIEKIVEKELIKQKEKQEIKNKIKRTIKKETKKKK